MAQKLPFSILSLLCLLMLGSVLSAQTYVNFTINQPAAPMSAFSYTNSGLTYDFTDGSSPTPTAWAWDFGDGNTSTTQNPSHTYATQGEYEVCLTITDGNNCTATTCDTILSVGINELPGLTGLTVYPNPFTQETRLTFELDQQMELKIELTDLPGRVVQVIDQGVQAPGMYDFRFGADLPNGVYLLSVKTAGHTLVRRVIRNQ